MKSQPNINSKAAMNQKASQLTQKKLKQAALASLPSVGLRYLKVADIVSRAKVARGTFYIHFRDVNHILRTISKEFMAGLEDNLSELSATLEIDKLLSSVMACYVHYVIDNQAAAGVTFQFVNDDEVVAKAYDDLLIKWADKSSRAILKTQESATGIAELKRLSFSMICMLEGYYRFAFRGETTDKSELLTEVDETINTFKTIWKNSIDVHLT